MNLVAGHRHHGRVGRKKHQELVIGDAATRVYGLTVMVEKDLKVNAIKASLSI